MRPFIVKNYAIKVNNKHELQCYNPKVLYCNFKNSSKEAFSINDYKGITYNYIIIEKRQFIK